MRGLHGIYTSILPKTAKEQQYCMCSLHRRRFKMAHFISAAVQTMVRHDMLLMLPQALGHSHGQLSVCGLHRVTCTAEAHGALHDRAAAANSTSSRLEFESCMPCKTLQMSAALSRPSRLPSSPGKLCVPGSDGYSGLETSARVRAYDGGFIQCLNHL